MARRGTSIGIAVITAVVFATLGTSSWPVAASTGFALIGVVVLLALGVALKYLRGRAKSDTTVSALSAEAQ